MAQKHKSAAPKTSGGASPNSARAAASPASTASTGNSALRAAVMIFALFCILGAIPTALGGEVFGLWRLPSSGVSLDSLPWTMSYDAPLAKPQPMVANALLHITTTPAGASSVATLEPGFAVKVTRFATVAGVRWAQVSWSGPTKLSGGSGWTLASGLIAFSGSTQARNIGDLGALSPTFGHTTAAIGAGFMATLYFPATGASYHTASIDRAQPLGTQSIPIVLAALYAKGIVASQPNAASGPPPIAHDLAYGNAQALTFDYALVGGAPGMDSFLTDHHVTGFQWVASQPLASQASARGLSLFYAALVDGSIVNGHDQAEILSLLAGANGAQSVAPQSVVGAGSLVVTEDTASGATVATAAGLLAPSNGAQVVIVVTSHAATSAVARQQLQAFFSGLIPLVQG